MKKNHFTIFLLLYTLLFTVLSLSAQVGINTKSPLGIFHIDPKNNTTSSTVGVSDDLIIDSNGNVGIGITPSNKLTIQNTGSNTGLHLPNGASSGKVLTSDVSGNAIWVSGAQQYQTMVEGAGGDITYTNAAGAVNAKQVKFFKVVFDKVKDIYGTAYGWNNTNQHYVVPVTGVYRIAYAVYFWPETRGVKGKNPRAYIFRNGALFPICGIVSVTDAGEEIIGYTMGLVSLNKGDIIDMRVCVHSSSTGVVKIYGGTGHTFFLIESL